ncbi:MAG: hypothetical protein Q8K96_06930 [Rubrivivax sp.]|nr:hypothetical protein [Rubrivivax sp.]
MGLFLTRVIRTALAVASLIASTAPPAQTPKSATEALNFKPADARMRAMLAPVKDLQGLLEGDFAVALADLDGDGQNEIIVKAELSPMQCGRDGACATFVLQQRGKRMVPLLAHQNTFSPLALTHAKYGGYRALAFVDENGRIEIGQRPGSPLYGKPMLYPMDAPKGAAAQR